MKRAATIVLVFGALVFLAVPAMADDLNPPAYRGAPLSYTAEWDLFTNGTFAVGIDADSESSTDDSDPNTYLHNGFSTHLDFTGTGWLLSPAQGGGFWNSAGTAQFAANVVNWIDDEPHKLLRIQVTYSGGPAPTITGMVGYNPVTGDPDSIGSLLGGLSIPSTYYYEDWKIIPNPDWEQIVFDLPTGTIVEQLVIDTVSPEPASLSLLALGGLALLRRRR